MCAGVGVGAGSGELVAGVVSGGEDEQVGDGDVVSGGDGDEVSAGDDDVVSAGDTALESAGDTAFVSAGDTAPESAGNTAGDAVLVAEDDAEAVVVDDDVSVADGEQLGDAGSLPLDEDELGPVCDAGGEDDCAARTWDSLPYAVARPRPAVAARKAPPAAVTPTAHPVLLLLLLNANSPLRGSQCCVRYLMVITGLGRPNGTIIRRIGLLFPFHLDRVRLVVTAAKHEPG